MLVERKELIYTGRRISAQEAKEYGLVEFVVPANLLEEKAIEIAEKIASNGPIAVRLAKEAISNGIQVDLHTGLQMEKQAYEGVIHTKDRLEGLQAFGKNAHQRIRGVNMLDQNNNLIHLKNELKRLNKAAHQSIMNKIKQKENYLFEIV